MDTEKGIDGLLQVMAELKRYATLQRDYVVLHLTEKLILLLSALMLAFAVGVMGAMMLFHLSLMAAYWLEPLVGSLTASHAVILGVLMLVATGVYLMRKRLIVRPIARFVSLLLFVEK